MKKIFSAILASTLVLSASAQSMYDGYVLAETDYLATARTMALAGAVSAVGADLGSISINPAGSAVAGYSQFTLTPGLSISSVVGSYALDPDANYQNPINKKNAAIKFPNIGLTGRYDCNGKSLRSLTLGFIVNSVADYNYVMEGYGVNSNSSKFGEMACAASGITPSTLGSAAFYNNSAYSNFWDCAMGYDIGLINNITGTNDYVGCSELLTSSGECYVPGDLNQSSIVAHSGYKSDVLMNIGLNFNDRFFVGFNMGIQNLDYSNSETFTEVAQVVEDFPLSFNNPNGPVTNTYFSNAAYQYNYTATGTGINGKMGFIWLPTNFLRLGFAYQTRTLYSIEETWQHCGSVKYANGTTYSGSSEKGYGEYDYYSPAVITAGAALTFGRLGLISVDYELMDYSRMKYESSYEGEEHWYDFENMAISEFSGFSRSLRIGAELNIGSDFALRGGYSYVKGPEQYYEGESGQITYSDFNDDYFLGRKTLPGKAKYFDDQTRTRYTLGLGYNPARSSYADFAIAYTTYPDTVFQPYYDYADVFAPRILSHRGRFNASLTIGWRF